LLTDCDQNTQKIVTNIVAFMLQLGHSCISTNQPHNWKLICYRLGKFCNFFKALREDID